MPRNTTDDEQLIFVQDGGVSRSAFGYGAKNLGLCPCGRVQIKYDEVGKICAVFVLAAEN